MKLGELFKEKTVLSFEVFPPKRDGSLESVFNTVAELVELKPDFISVTHGAGGAGARDSSTIEIASRIEREHNTKSVAHLPSMYLTREGVLEMLDELRARGIQNILALRGDRVSGVEGTGDFPFASDLVRFIKESGDFHVAAASYPEGHTECSDLVTDIWNLRTKVDAGADHLITQLFFDNECFYRFRERAAIAGIEVPIQAGIMPVINKRQIERMVTLCGASLPQKFVRMMDRFGHDDEAMRAAGIAYALDQIVDLLAEGVDGIHLYTMNDPGIAKAIYKPIQALSKA